MPFISWITLCGICLLGAMSPGPSLAVILQNRVQKNLGDAIIASWSHAVGIFFWALAACTTIGSLFQRFPSVQTSVTVAGAFFLIYLAITSWGGHDDQDEGPTAHLPSAFVSGISISFLNPKIFAFFTVLFSQFIPQGAGLSTLLAMALVAFIVDGTWYSLVSLLVGHVGLDRYLNSHALILNRASAGLYLLIAVATLYQAA